MKVILNKDLATLGEEGDVKDVAKGYARNYLFPRGIALPYTERNIKLFESRRGEIEARKEEKRKDAAGIREKLESLEISITMPAGANGKLYGAVTSQTIADELARQGYQIERKRIELAGNSFKNVGKYRVTVKLYESASAGINVTILGQAVKTETSQAPAKGRRMGRRPAAEADRSSENAEPAAETSGAVKAPPADAAVEKTADPAPASEESGTEQIAEAGAGA
ncbi:MAG: 50S ribosomal protein L9 [Treponema sp.]|jgi:large subunit ribosomal protein L9|nr:50S ribosomal protein L9 [Treponema sp.]